MATWIAHLRIAENILNEGLDFDKEAFVAGNIAPDAGVPNEDWSKFNPPPDITHWRDSNGNIDANSFFNKYVKCLKSIDEKEAHSFVLGYFTHLLTDIEWGKLYEFKKKESLYKDKLDKDPKFIWRIKEDWYGLDFEYLKENENSLFFTCFQYIFEVKDYLDYFPEGAFTNRFKYIREMYLKNYKQSQRDFIYLSKSEMDNFIDSATKNIIPNLKLRTY